MNMLEIILCGISTDKTICTSEKWSKYEDEVIREFYPDGGAEAVNKLLPCRTPASIHIHASRIGVKRASENENMVARGEQALWTEQEDKIIRMYYWKEGANACQIMIKRRTICAIRKRASELGVHRDLRYLKCKVTGNIMEAEKWLYRRPVFSVPIVR